MNKLKKIGFIVMMIWGVYPISTYYQNIIEIQDCNKFLNDKVKYDMPVLLHFSVYSTLFSSFLITYDLYKNRINKILGMMISGTVTTNVLTGFILFYSIMIPESIVKGCSKNVIFTVLVTSLITELILLGLVLLSLIGVFILLESIFHLVKHLIILPIIQKNLRQIFMLFLTAWLGLLIWSIIVFEKNSALLSLGIIQIFFVSMSMYFLDKNYTTSFRKYFRIVTILGIAIFIMDIILNRLTIFGIISFLSVPFYITYFGMKKTVKIYERYLVNKMTEMQDIPTEPPAIYASGQVYNSCFYDTKYHKKLIIKF